MSYKPWENVTEQNPFPVQIVSAPAVFTYSNKPLANSVPVGSVIFISDIGGGTHFFSNGTAWRSIAATVRLHQEFEGAALPVDTDWHLVSSFTLPGGLLQHGDGLFLDYVRFERTQSSNRTDLKIVVGGQTLFESYVTNTSGTLSNITGVVNGMRVIDSTHQIGSLKQVTEVPFGVNSMTVDLSTPQPVELWMRKVVGSELLRHIESGFYLQKGV